MVHGIVEENISLIFALNSESNASKFAENLEKMFPL